MLSRTEVQLAMPSPSAFVYGSVSAKRRLDGWWYVAVFIADRSARENEGTWVFLWSEGRGPGQPVAPRPLLRGTGILELGIGGLVQLWGIHEQSQVAVVDVGHTAATDRPG